MKRLKERASLHAALVLGALLCCALTACSKSPSEASADPQAKPASSASSDQGTLGPAGPLLADDQLRMLTAPPGDDAAEVVKAERARQVALGRSTIVYVGAKWCEPCQHFHKAAAAGKLDKAFPKLTIVEFDADADGDRLKRAGYRSQYIPLFIVPDENGRPTDKRMEGSVKGDGAVDEIVPRLKRILN